MRWLELFCQSVAGGVSLGMETNSMTLHLELPPDVAAELAERAKQTGRSAEQLALAAIQRTLYSDQRLAEVLAPVHEAFRQSGMTEDEAVELFEAEKHAMRRGE
jgi:protein-disulfide isomerase-like protein with CxxC motif